MQCDIPVPLSTPRVRLLCVDDEADIRTILTLALSLDPSIHAVVTGSAAELLARAAEPGWDAFIMDGMMPGIDGYELCERLKSDPATAHVPVLFLTAKTQREEQDRAFAKGAMACLTKPFDPLTLAADIRTALGK